MTHHPVATRIWAHLQDDYRNRFWRRNHTFTQDYSFHWCFGDRRLSDKRRENVLTIEVVDLPEHLQGQGVMTSLITMIRESDTPPWIPLKFLHFQECNTDFGRLLEQLHFHRYHIAQAIDWWLPITGQKELVL